MDNQNYNSNPYQQNGGYQYDQNNNRFQQDANAYPNGDMRPSEGVSQNESIYQNEGVAQSEGMHINQNENMYQSEANAQNEGLNQNRNIYQNGSLYQNSSLSQNPGMYQQGSGMYQNENSNIYQNGSIYQNSNIKEQPKKKKKKEKENSGFGVKIAKCAAYALVFGLVAGTVMTGVNYASGKLLGTVNNQSAASNAGTEASLVIPENPVKATATANILAASNVPDIVEEVMPSLVAITNISVTEYQSFWGRPQTYESTSCGSGIIVSQDNNYLYIATNNHVVDGARTLTVTFADDATVSAEVKGTDPSTDLAVVRVDLNSIDSSTMNSIKLATLGDSDSLRIGEQSIAIGNALGYGQSVTTGCISALNREVTVSDSSSNTSYTAELIQTEAAINPGNSGGALLNSAGEVIGINSVKYSSTDVEGIGYAIPISTAAPIIEDLITKEKVDEADSSYLGITGLDMTSDVASLYNMPTGLYVQQVAANSPAEQAGILHGDIIKKFDGREITSMDSLVSILEYYAAGTTVDITVMRMSNGEYLEQVITVTLGNKR